VRAGLGLGVLGFLLAHVDRASLMASITNENPSFFVLALSIYLLGQALCAFRWQILAQMVELRGSINEFLSYYFIGIFTNLFVPGLIGGDAARVLYLGGPRGKVGAATASVMADRAIGLVALLWFAAAAMLWLGGGILPQLMIQTLAAAAAVGFFCYLTFPLIDRVTSVMPRPLRRIVALVEPYNRRQLAMIPLLAISVVLHVSQVVAQYVLARGLGLHIPFSIFLLCVPVTNALVSLPITLNGLGAREGLYVALFTTMGIGRADAVALGLLWFACITAGSLFGAPAFIFTPAPQIKLRERFRGEVKTFG
jgi:uncharacterized membrane protein YbhN (UPF0104 family)